MSSIDLWYLSRATGIVALVLFTGTMVLGVLTATRGTPRFVPRFVRQELHRRLSLLSLVFLAVHILTALLDSYVHIGWLAAVVPFVSPYQPLWIGLGTVAVDLMLALVVSSLLRPRLNARVWRAIHWLAYACWPIAIAHTIGLGTDLRLGWVTLLTVACIAVVVGAAGWRIGETVRVRRRAVAHNRAVLRPHGVPLKYLHDRGALR